MIPDQQGRAHVQVPDNLGQCLACLDIAVVAAASEGCFPNDAAVEVVGVAIVVSEETVGSHSQHIEVFAVLVKGSTSVFEECIHRYYSIVRDGRNQVTLRMVSPFDLFASNLAGLLALESGREYSADEGFGCSVEQRRDVVDSAERAGVAGQCFEMSVENVKPGL